MTEYCRVCGQSLETEEEKDMGVHIECSVTLAHYATIKDGQLFIRSEIVLED